MAKRGRIKVKENFSADAMVEGTLRVFEKLIAEKGTYYGRNDRTGEIS